jgi:hypothetical protein
VAELREPEPDTREAELQRLRERCEELGLAILGEIDTPLTQWQPGLILNLTFGSKRLDPLRDEYSVGPGGEQTIVELRP